MAEQLPDSAARVTPPPDCGGVTAAPLAWQRKGAWRIPTRVLSAFTAIAFISTQILAAAPALAEHDQLPAWLQEDQGGWVSVEQAQAMHQADQELLAFLSSLESAQQRFVTSHPSGLEVQYADQEAVVARDSAGNFLWAPTLDDYQRIWNGTLLLVDETLQVVKEGRLARQVDVVGNETVFRADGRVDHETAADGTRTDYAYSETGFTRTTHNPTGDLVQEYNAEGRLIRETTPEGKVSTYSNGILSTVSVGGSFYAYSSETTADGTITATLSEAQGPDGTVYTFADGQLATIRWTDGASATGVQLDAQGNLTAGDVLLPDGTQQTIAAGTIRDVLLPDGRALRYDAGWLRQLQAGSVASAYSYTFDAGGNLTSITVTATDGSSRVYTSSGTLQGLADPDGTHWTVVDGLITQSDAPNGTATTYARMNTPYGQQIVRQSAGVTDRFSFDPSGALYAAGSDRNLAGATPFTSPLQSFNAGTLTNAGIVATDGTYLYVKPISNSTKIFTKVGTGLGGTVAGKAYGTITGSAGSTMSASMHSDGFLYQPDPTNPTRVDRINPATGAKGFVAVPAGLLRWETAKAERGNVLITSDGRYVYNLSYHQTRNRTTYNGWTVRVFDPKNNWALVKEFTAGTTSFKANGLMSDGTFLYAVEWTNSNSARVAVIRIADGAVVKTWTANQGTTKIVGGQYDWVNQRFWLGARSTGKVYAYDDPNDLPISAWVEREGLRAPITQTQLGDMDRLSQPANPYSTDLQTRVEQDLPGVRLTYPGQPGAVPTTPADGLWNQADWPVTPDTLPPAGTMEMPALTDQREITLTLSALDPAAADGTSGSGVRMMRFSFNSGETWDPPEPFADSKTVTLPEQDGDYTVQAQFQDAAGHWSEPLAGTVTLRLGSGTLAPVLSLLSAGTTDTELYDFLFAADEITQPSQRWRLGRGRHLLIASAANPAGKESWAGFAVTRSGEPLPEPAEPPPLPEGPRVTQTLADGSVALFVEGALVSITTPAGMKLLHPTRDDAGRITGGWLIAPDGTTTFLQDGVAVWSKDSFGSVTWYFPDGRPEAVRGKDGTMTAFAYRLDDTGQMTAALITTGNTSTLVDTTDKPVMQIRADGSRLLYTQGRLSAIESVGQPAIHYTESVQPDGSIVSERPGSAESDQPLRWIYEAEGSLREVTQPDGTVIRFSAGIPTEAVALDGTVTTLILGSDPAGSDPLRFLISRSGITRRYTGGQLDTLALPDQAALELQGEALQGLRLADGTQVSDGVYDADSRLVSGRVTLPDGRAVRYEGGQPVEATLPDGSHVTYLAGEPAGLTLPSGLTYSLVHETGRWVAALVLPPEGTPASDTLTGMVYSDEWALQEAARADGAWLVYADGRLSTLTQANGTVISYAYDSAGRLANTVAASPDAAEPVIRTEYAYDRIRRVYKGSDPTGSDLNGVLLYEYSYEFDADGNEITVLRDLQADRVKRYRDGLLVSQTDPDGAVTTYEYTTNPAGYQDPMENTLEARQVLPDGSAATYRRAGSADPWQMNRIVLASGTEYSDLSHPDIAGQVGQAELPADRLSLFRLQRQGRLEAVGVSAAAAGANSPKIAMATVRYQERLRASYTYRYEGTLTRVTDQEGVTRVYDESNRLVAIEQIEGPSYSVSAAKDLSPEQMAQLEELDPSSPEALQILNNPNGEEIFVHRLTRLTLADGTVVTENFAPDTLVGQEFDSQGRLLTRSQANGQITLYEDGRPTQTLDAEGNVTTDFTYDEAGQLVKLTLHGARRELTEGTAAARAEVIRKRADALEELAELKQLAIGQLADQTAQARTELQNQLTDLGQMLGNLENTDVHGRSAKRQKGRALDQIRHGMNQVRDALSSLDQQYAQALGGLESQVGSVRNQLESQSASAFASITAQEEEFTRTIIRQEITVILTRVYRNVIGRDPDEAETVQAVDQLYAQFGANPDAALDLTALEQKIRALPDYPARVQQVAQIRQAVSDRLAVWETASEEQRTLQLAPYGIPLSRTVPLNSESIAQIRTWLNTNSLHFGHSAFLALQGLIAQEGATAVDTVTLAVEAIWLDILSGVISPRTTGDLEMSLFSLQHVSQRYGLDLTPARVSFQEMAKLLPPALTHFRLVSPDGRMVYEFREDGVLQAVDLERDEVKAALSLSDLVPPPAVSVSLAELKSNALGVQARGLPVSGIVTSWVENDLRGEPGVWYIQPISRSNVPLSEEGYAQLLNWRDEPDRRYRAGHTQLLFFKDLNGLDAFLSQLNSMHSNGRDAETYFYHGGQYRSELDRLLKNKAFIQSTGMRVHEVAEDGTLGLRAGSWDTPAEPGLRARQAVLSPDGSTLWILAVGRSSTQTVLIGLDLTTYTVKARWTHLGTPTHLAISPDGKTLFLRTREPTGDGLSSILRVETETGVILGQAGLPVREVSGMAFDPMGQILLSANRSATSGELLWLDANTLEQTRTLEGFRAIKSIALRPDGKVLYLVEDDRKLVILDVASGSRLREIDLGARVGDVVFSPDGTVVYLSRQDTGTVVRIDAASHQTLPDSPESESKVTQALRRRTAPILAHVNGNHYVHLLAITPEGKLLVREPNKGPSGSIIAMDPEEFSRIWQGVILSPRAPPHAYQRLTDSEALSITGSFFPVLFAIFAAVASAIGAAVGAIIGAVSALLATLGAVLSSVFSALGTAFSSIGSFFSGFGSLFSGAGLVGQGVSSLFAGKLLTGLALIGKGILGAVGLSSFSWAGLGQFALTTAVNVGVSRGLEALGVSPTIASLASAFASGGIAGALNPVSTTSTFLSNFAAGAVTSTAIAGTQLGLVKAGLDPALASLAGIGVGTITNSLTVSGFDGLGQTLSTQLAPTLAGELAFYGIQKLGETIGLDPRISQLAGITLRTGIGNIANPGNATQNVLKGIQDGLTRGALQIGLSFATQGLDPLLGGLASSAITGAIDGLVSPANPNNPVDPKKKGIFAGIADTLAQAVGGFSQIGVVKAGDPVGNAQRLAQLNDFSNIIREQGLGAALESYATSLLYRSSVESLIHAGNSLSIQQIVNAQLSNPLIVELEGQNVIQIALGNGGYLWVDPTTHGLVASLQRQDYIRYVAPPKVDPATGVAGTPDVIIERTYPIPNDATSLDAATITARIREEISAGGVVKVTIEGRNGTRYTVTPNSLQHVRFNADGTVADGILTDAGTGVKLYFQDGKLVKTHRPVTLISKDPTTGEPTLALDAGAVTETLTPEGQLQGLALELAHELQNRYGPMTVQFSEDGRGALFVDQEGRLILQYRDGKVVETTVLGDVTKLVKLWEGIPGMIPQGFTLPAERVQLERDMGTMLGKQFSQDSEKTRQALDDFNAHKAELLGLSIPLGSVPSKQILNPPLKSRRILAGGVVETTEEYTYLGYMPTAPSTTDFTLVYDPTRGFFLEFDTKAAVQKIGSSELYAYATAKRTWYGDANPFSVAAGGGSDFTLTTAEQVDVTGTIRIGVGTSGLTVTGKAQGMKDGQQMGAVQTKSFTASGDDSADPFNLSIKNLMMLFNPSAIKPTEMILNLGLVRTTFMSGQDPLGIGQQMGDQLIGLIRHQAEVQGVRIIELK